MNRYFSSGKRQSGISLIENLVAAGIIAGIGVVFMNALFTGYTNVGIMNEQQTAEILIRSQLEAIKHGPFEESGIYPISVEVPSHFSMTINSTSPQCIGEADNCVTLDALMGESITTIQEVTVTIYHDGQYVLSVGCYKAVQ